MLGIFDINPGVSGEPWLITISKVEKTFEFFNDVSWWDRYFNSYYVFLIPNLMSGTNRTKR